MDKTLTIDRGTQSSTIDLYMENYLIIKRYPPTDNSVQPTLLLASINETVC